MSIKENENTEKQNGKINAGRKKYLIQMIDIKDDGGMTRVYSAICKPENINPDKNNDEQS